MMQIWELIPALIGGLAAAFFFGSVIWGVFDILGDERLEASTRVLWLMVIFLMPFFGIIAWLYVRPGVPEVKGRSFGVVRHPRKF